MSYLIILKTRNSSGDEIANVNFLYDDIVHALKMQLSGPSLPVPVELVSGDMFIDPPECVDAPEC